jgi:hypothetical protein
MTFFEDARAYLSLLTELRKDCVRRGEHEALIRIDDAMLRIRTLDPADDRACLQALLAAGALVDELLDARIQPVEAERGVTATTFWARFDAQVKACWNQDQARNTEQRVSSREGV